MKFEIKTKEIKEFVKKVSSLVPIFSALPHESGVLISVDETKVTLKSRNEYIALKVETNDIDTFKVVESGKVLVKGKMLNDIISKMTGSTITFSKIDRNILVIKSNDAEYEINILNEDNYEDFDINYSVEQGNEFIVKAKEIKESIQKVIPAVPEKHQRKILQGVNIHYEEGKIIFTATNGTRIHRASLASNYDMAIDSTINIKSVKEILKILSDNKEAKFKFSNNYLVIEDKHVVIKTKLIDGVYPDLSKAFSFGYTKELVIEKELFLELLDRSTLLGNAKTENGITKIIINNGELRFEAREIEIGYSNVKTTNFKFNYDERFEITFSPKYMEEAIKALNNKKVRISMSESANPIKIWSKETVDFEAIVLPYKTN